MQPIFFHAFGYPVQAYGLLIAVGYLAALFLIRRLARFHHLDPGPYTDLCFIALCAGLVGGRALFVLTNLAYFREHPVEIVEFWGGGLVFYGGFLTAFPAALLYLRHRKLPLPLSLDVLAPGLAIGHAFGRIGCFFAGCCHGRYCELPWAVRLHSDQVEPALRGLGLHPTQLYEAAGLFLLTGLLAWLHLGRKAKAGTVALVYLMGYAALRAVVEIFRGDSIRGTLAGTPLSTSQLIAAVLFLGGGLALFRRFRRDQ